MEISLHSNAWHRRFQMWTLNDAHMPKIQNLCPYFWLTVLCFFISPFVAAYRIASTPAGWLADRLIDFFDYADNCVVFKAKKIRDLRYYNELSQFGKWGAISVVSALGGYGLLMWILHYPASFGIVSLTCLSIGSIIVFLFYLDHKGIKVPGWATFTRLAGLLIDVTGASTYWLFSKLLAPFPFLWGYVSAAAHQLCPAINWVQEEATS